MSYSSVVPENHAHSKTYGSGKEAKKELLAILRWHWPEPQDANHKVENEGEYWVCFVQVDKEQTCTVEVGKLHTRRDALIVVELITSVYPPERHREPPFRPGTPPKYGLMCLPV